MHAWIDSTGKHDFEPFFKLEIKQRAGESWCHLFRFSADNRIHGRIAETWHKTVEDALDTAQWEFGVQADEWQSVTQERTE